MTKHVQKPNPRLTTPRQGFTVAEEKTLAEFVHWWRHDMKPKASQQEELAIDRVLDFLDRDDLTKTSLTTKLSEWSQGHGQTLVHLTEVLRQGVEKGIGEGYDPDNSHKTILQEILTTAEPMRRMLDEKDPLRPAN
ncbi:MAG: hypothetical protein ABH834_03295 [Candidatus Altiarchaeota archaeon]